MDLSSAVKSTWRDNRDRATKKGSKISETLISLDALAGTYHFLWDSWTDMENFMDIDDEETFITLKVDSGKVGGSFLWWRKVGSFQELTRDENEKTNYWDIGKVEWTEREGYEVEDDDEEEGARKAHGHGLAILKTLDDKGRPFIELIYDTGKDGVFVRALGKKMDDRHKAITDSEASRLHRDGVVTLEAHDVEGSDGDGAEEEDEEGSESSGNDAKEGGLDEINVAVTVSDGVAAGKKRKAEDELEAEPSSIRKAAAPKSMARYA